MVELTRTNHSLIAAASCALLLAGCSAPAEDSAADSSAADSTATAEAMAAEIGSQTVQLTEHKPEVAPVAENNEPNRFAMNLPEDPSTEMSFNWYTTDEIEDSVVRVSKDASMAEPVEFPAETQEVTSEYAERDADGFYIYADVTTDDDGDFLLDDEGKPEEIRGYFTDEQLDRSNKEWTGEGSKLGYLELHNVTEYTNKATATGLEPGAEYFFEVGSETEGFSDVGSFRTSAADAEEFSFIHYTDTQNAYWNANVNNEAEYGANTLELARETAPEALFALHTGDFVETASVEDEWVDNLDFARESNLHLPHAYTPGNHDEYNLIYHDDKDLTAFNEHTNVPVPNDAVTGGSYYSFDHSGAHFVVLNTNDNKESADNPEQGAIGREQMEWAKQDIAEARKNGANWVVLAYHKPVYSASYHALQDEDVQVTREEFVQLADELGVDIVMQGHDHNLTRTKSLVYTPDNFAYGEVENTEKKVIDGVEYHVNPEGVTYVIPNTSGTKAYDAIYQKGAEHVANVRPKLDWMTTDDTDYWNNLYDVAEQPDDSTEFEDSHSNYRQSQKQSFAVYTVSENTFKIDFYQVEGDLDGERTVKLRDSYGIAKE